ncbi:MAG: response regulator [Bacteroidaceae bacterium]
MNLIISYIIIGLAIGGNAILALLLINCFKKGRENDRFLREILDSLPFPVHVKDVENGFVYRYFNRKSIEEFGDGLLRKASDLVTKENAEQIEKIDKEVYDTGITYTGKEELLYPDGKRSRTLVHKSVIHFEGRLQVLIVRWDIGNFIDLQEQLKEANRRNEVILNHVNAGLAYITPDFVVQWENLSRFSDHPEAKLYVPGEVCYKIRHGLNEPCSHCLMLKAMKTKSVHQRKMVLDNDEIIEFTVTPVLDQQNEIEGYVTRIDNVTERERIHAELEQAKLKAERSDELKSTFLANISHEIRTPLNAIVGFTDMMRYVDSNKERDEYHAIIESNAKNLINLVEDVLELSQIESGALTLELCSFNLVDMLQHLVMQLRLQLQSDGNVEILTEFPEKELWIVADRMRINQIINNFATNALKFTKRGSVTLGYELIQPKRIRLYVKDTGIGISEENYLKVFDRFEKLNSYMQGTGLGLSIAKSLVKLMGGEIGVESKPAVGSTFWTLIPLVSQKNNLKKNLEDSVSKWNENLKKNHEAKNYLNLKESAAAKKRDTEEPQLKRILVAEDNESNALVVFSCLKNKYDLVRASNGKEAFAIMKVQSFDLILMDLKMPEMDGIEATRKIREFNTKVPIIAVTAYAFEEERAQAIEAGCNGILTKPIHRSILLETVSNYLGNTIS